MDEMLEVTGLPDLTGKLDFEGRARARALEEELTREDLACALVEREEQLKDLLLTTGGRA